jgi:hypothetical protein
MHHFVPSLPVLTVKATDADEGDFGHVTYSLSGTYKNAFAIGLEDGTISVLDPGVLDREATETISLQVCEETRTTFCSPIFASIEAFNHSSIFIYIVISQIYAGRL